MHPSNKTLYPRYSLSTRISSIPELHLISVTDRLILHSQNYLLYTLVDPSFDSIYLQSTTDFNCFLILFIENKTLYICIFAVKERFYAEDGSGEMTNFFL
jgi:hypothetical protein